MKTRLGMIILVLFMGIILGASQPTSLYAGFETPEGFVWDQFVDPGPYKGKSLTGPLSIYYEINYPYEYCTVGGSMSYMTTMYYTVRLLQTKVKANGKVKEMFYTFQGKAENVCLADIETQGTIIKEDFLGSVVIPGIFPNGFKSWKLKSIDNGTIGEDGVSVAFVADIEIVVDKK